MKLKAIIEKASDGTYSIYHDCEGLKFLVTGTGKTLEDAKAEFLQGYEDIKEFKAEKGEPMEDIEWKWCYDTASFIREYAYAFTLAGLSRITGVSQGVLSHYANGTSRPSAKTRMKIKEGVDRFAKSLSSVEFA